MIFKFYLNLTYTNSICKAKNACLIFFFHIKNFLHVKTTVEIKVNQLSLNFYSFFFIFFLDDGDDSQVSQYCVR